MAGERVGKTYEAILRLALEKLKDKGVIHGNVFWNETPEGISVEPDFLIGCDKDHPTVVIMVTHSGSLKNSDMKCWRNIGELCEAKSVLTPVPFALNIVFDSIMKENLKALQEVAFDGQLIIGDKDYGAGLAQWVNEIDAHMPISQEEKVEKLRFLQKTDTKLKKYISAIIKDLTPILECGIMSSQELWEQERKRVHGKAPIAKNTYVRRGFTKRILVGEAIKGEAVCAADALWLSKIGIAGQSISGFRVIDPDLKWFLSSPFSANYCEIAKPCMTGGFEAQLKRVKTLALIGEYERYVIENYDKLITKQGMLDCLRNQHNDPSFGLCIPDNIQKPENIWIYDFVAALSKAAAGRSQAFGYSFFSQHPSGQKSKVGNMLLGRWCTSFICEYFNRKNNFVLPENAEDFVAEVLSEQLSNFDLSTIKRLSGTISNQFVAKEYEAVLLAHRGFEPLLALLINGRVATGTADKINIRTCFSEKAGLTGQAGKTTVIKVQNTIINWQTATDAGKDHKRKELCGRAVGLRYHWDDNIQKFIPRPGVKKLILLLDGTWSQKDLNALINAGWDEIYYPDEIDKLKAAIV